MKTFLISVLRGLLWLLDPDHRRSHQIESDNHKFTDVIEVDFQSDFGRASRVMRTVPYEAWEVRTAARSLIAADQHRVIRQDHSPAYLTDLRVGDVIKTQDGIEAVTACRSLGVRTHMYALEVATADDTDAHNHLYYTNGLLSHNTTCAASYLLWRAMFVPDTIILITANKYLQALEIMGRIRYAYENVPDHIRAGVIEYNKGSITFDNQSRIVARATSADAGRGISATLLYCLDGSSTVSVRDKATGAIQHVTLEQLYNLL